MCFQDLLGVCVTNEKNQVVWVLPPIYMLLLSCRCPYYVSRELHKVADILFAPYNYLIDRNLRKILGVDWNNSILIFDEAHNLVREYN